jgi:hypothetical protein
MRICAICGINDKQRTKDRHHCRAERRGQDYIRQGVSGTLSGSGGVLVIGSSSFFSVCRMRTWLWSGCMPGRRKVAVKVVDIFGNDTMKIIEVTIGGRK